MAAPPHTLMIPAEQFGSGTHAAAGSTASSAQAIARFDVRR